MTDTGLGGLERTGIGLLRVVASTLLAASLLAWTRASNARAADYRVELTAFPSLGSNAPVVDGWFSCFVKLANPGDTAMSGTVELVSEGSHRNVSRAPFFLPPRGRASLELPARGFHGVPPSLVARALDEEGRLLGEQNLSDLRLHQPLLFDLDVPSRIAPVLRGRGVPVAPRRSQARYGAPALAVQSPQINAETGDAMLPDSAAGYASVTVLFARSETLAKLSGSALAALGGWVLAGGALAVAVTRPEDLRGPLLMTLTGSEIKRRPPPAKLVAATRFPIPRSMPSLKASIASQLIAPSPEIVSALSGYSGGNLHDSRWGASASYGLGEVHLLAFDATREPFTSDEWVKYELVDLVAHAWQRRVVIALPHAQSALDVPGFNQIRRRLDPTEGTRWTLIVAGLLLLVYAIGAGPEKLYRAMRQNLRSLWLLPIWSLLAFVSIVVFGVLARGVFGRARRLTLVEAGAGMPRAAATRFRGFFTMSPDALMVRGSDRTSVLDGAGYDASADRRLLVGRDGSQLEGLHVKPWQTVIVREDGFIALGGGISLVPAPGGDVAIKNRLARDLLGVVVKPPGKPAVLLGRLRDGQTVLASQCEELKSSIGRTTRIGALALHELGAETFAPELDQAAVGLGASWRAFEALAPDVDWWPSDVPVLIAEVDGGEGQSADSGVKVESDRVLLRVVGWGGVG